MPDASRLLASLLVFSVAAPACKAGSDTPAAREKAIRCARTDDRSKACEDAVSAVTWDDKRYEAFQCVHPKACWFKGEVWLRHEDDCAAARRLDNKAATDCESKLVPACAAAMEKDCESLVRAALGSAIVDSGRCSWDTYLEPGDPLENCEASGREFDERSKKR